MLSDAPEAVGRDSRPVIDRLRSELIWLSAQEAGVRNLAFTRSLTPREQAQIAQLRSRSDALQARLDRMARWAADA